MLPNGLVREQGCHLRACYDSASKIPETITDFRICMAKKKDDRVSRRRGRSDFPKHRAIA
jgi:hypothetical protein